MLTPPPPPTVLFSVGFSFHLSFHDNYWPNFHSKINNPLWFLSIYVDTDSQSLCLKQKRAKAGD